MSRRLRKECAATAERSEGVRSEAAMFVGVLSRAPFVVSCELVSSKYKCVPRLLKTAQCAAKGPPRMNGTVAPATKSLETEEAS